MRRRQAVCCFLASAATGRALPAQAFVYGEADYQAGPSGEGNVVTSPHETILANKVYRETGDGGMAVVDPNDALIGYNSIFSTQNELSPPQGPVPMPFHKQGPLGVDVEGEERPLKGYGELKHKGPFRTFDTKINCDAYTYASGCGGRSRGPPHSANHCIWCVSIDVCVQGDITTGPDEVGLAVLASKGVRCDNWLTALL